EVGWGRGPRRAGDAHPAEGQRLGLGDLAELLVEWIFVEQPHVFPPCDHRHPALTIRPFFSSTRSTATRSPSRMSPASNALANGSPMADWTRRRTGPAPQAGTYPLLASQPRAAGLTSSASRRSASRRPSMLS